MLTITHEQQLQDPNTKILSCGLDSNAKLQRGHKKVEDFAFFLRDAHNNVVGGCNGVIYYGCLFTDQLWVDEKFRGQNYGTKLIQHAETYAKQQGCTFATIETMDWQALGFYQKLGYSIEMARHGYTNNAVMYLLRKDW